MDDEWRCIIEKEWRRWMDPTSYHIMLVLGGNHGKLVNQHSGERCLDVPSDSNPSLMAPKKINISVSTNFRCFQQRANVWAKKPSETTCGNPPRVGSEHKRPYHSGMDLQVEVSRAWWVSWDKGKPENVLFSSSKWHPLASIGHIEECFLI